jgi:hypothetical protein
MAKRGRPGLLDPTYDGQREKLLDDLRLGIPQNIAIIACGLGRSTVLRALADGKNKRAKAAVREFRESYVQARAEGLAALHRRVVTGTKKSPALALRLLSKLDPMNYNPEVMARWAAIEAGLEDDASALRTRAGVTVRREKKAP